MYVRAMFCRHGVAKKKTKRSEEIQQRTAALHRSSSSDSGGIRSAGSIVCPWFQSKNHVSECAPHHRTSSGVDIHPPQETASYTQTRCGFKTGVNFPPPLPGQRTAWVPTKRSARWSSRQNGGRSLTACFLPTLLSQNSIASGSLVHVQIATSLISTRASTEQSPTKHLPI